MIVSIIAAMAENRVIGKEGAIPWHLPEDLKRFRELTWGHPVIMGRKTYESIGRPLPGRTNIVLTRQPDYQARGGVVAGSLPEALAACAGAEEAFVCGGGEIYREALPVAEKIYLTIVHREFDGDTLCPEIPSKFAETCREELPGEIPCTFILYSKQ